MTLKYSRRGGHKPPRDMEELEIEADGTFSLWRSVGWATQPPSPVGRFKGQLDPGLNTIIEQEINQARQAGKVEIPLLPDSPVETVNLEGAQLKLGIHDTPAGSWGALITHLRSLLGELTIFPQAAIALEITSDGQKARLVHQGTQPLQLNLQNLSVRAVLWQEYNAISDWYAPTANANSPQQLTASKNWSLDLPFQHNFELKADCRVAAYVNFAALKENQETPVSLEASSIQK